MHNRSPWVTRKRTLVALGAATLGFTISLYLLDPHTQGYGAPTISDFEFAASSSRAAQIMAEWGPEGRRLAHLGLLLDYGYMISYGLFFALAGFAVRDAARTRGWRRLAKAGIVVPYLALAAACFDAAENVALLLTLGGHGGTFAPPFAAVCSSFKWALIGVAILYALCGLVLLLRDGLPTPPAPASTIGSMPWDQQLRDRAFVVHVRRRKAPEPMRQSATESTGNNRAQPESAPHQQANFRYWPAIRQFSPCSPWVKRSGPQWLGCSCLNGFTGCAHWATKQLVIAQRHPKRPESGGNQMVAGS